MAHDTDKLLVDQADNLTDDEKSAIETALADLKASIEKEDTGTDEFKPKIEALLTASQALAQRLYAQAQEEAAASAGDSTEGDSDDDDDDDVVEAEIIDDETVTRREPHHRTSRRGTWTNERSYDTGHNGSAEPDEPTEWSENLDEAELDVTAEAAEIVTAESLGIELPDDDPATARAVLLGEVAGARAMAADYLDQFQRKAAEFDNYRKRIAARNSTQIRELGAERLVSALLPVLDSFDAALALPAESETERRLLAGMSGTYDQLVDALSREGFSAVPGVGAPFDPTVHEAVSSPPEATGALMVAHELRRGYRLKDKVLRASLVALDESNRRNPNSMTAKSELRREQGLDRKGLLRGLGRFGHGQPRRDQTRLPQARPGEPSRRESRQPGSRGQVQGCLRGLRHSCPTRNNDASMTRFVRWWRRAGSRGYGAVVQAAQAVSAAASGSGSRISVTSSEALADSAICSGRGQTFSCARTASRPGPQRRHSSGIRGCGPRTDHHAFGDRGGELFSLQGQRRRTGNQCRDLSQLWRQRHCRPEPGLVLLRSAMPAVSWAWPNHRPTLHQLPWNRL